MRAAPIFCPEKNPYFFADYGPKGCRERAESPLLASWATTLPKKFPPAGPDAPTPARIGTGRPMGRSHFFSVAKEKCAKESQRHGDSRGGPPRFASRASSCGSPSGCPRPRFASLTRREKSPLLPILAAGLFPSAAYRRSAPAQLAVGRLIPCGVGCFLAAWAFLQRG